MSQKWFTHLVLLFIFLLVLATHFSFAMAEERPVSAEKITSITGQDLFSAQPETVSAKGKKGLVVVFLSAVCPCSNSHIDELKALSSDFKDFAFVAVHANSDEKKNPSQKYFRTSGLPFPVLRDQGGRLADQFRAAKTPHAFVVNFAGEIVYRGGVSSSQDFKRAEHKFLRDALNDLSQGRAVRVATGRTLGCIIARGEKSDW